MPQARTYHHAFNIGVVDKDKMARVDLERMRLAAEEQTNLLPLTTGKMFLRPGQQYLGTSRNGTLRPRLKEFIFGVRDAALMEFTNERLRVWLDDALITRPSVSSAITSGTFSSSSGWTDGSTTGATATISGGLLRLTAAAKGSLALMKQQVSTSSAGTEHALRIIVERGPVTFRCGSTEGGDQYVSETTLGTGTHSLAFTPSGSYWVQFQTESTAEKQVNSIEVESAGVMEIPTPWPTLDLPLLRFAQSGDVVFIAANGYQQRRIERRSTRSWSVVLYQSDDGPFTGLRTAAVRLRPSVLQGNGTLTSNKPFFKSSHVGALFRLDQNGQRVVQQIAGNDEYTDPIRVVGVESDEFNDRAWTYTISGTWSGTLRVQRSFDDEEVGYNSGDTPITMNGSGTVEDGEDNAILYYRIGFGESDYSSGVATVTVDYNGGGDYGICRVVGYTSSTQVDIEVLRPFVSTRYTSDWREGEWSDRLGWPAGVAFFDGRLWWGGQDRVWGSISDAYDSFTEEEEGDAGPIIRSIATGGGINETQWVLPLLRLIFGTEGSEASARSSSFDEPLTPTNITIRDASTIGSSPVDPLKVDTKGLFVDRSGAHLFEMAFQAEASDYVTTELSKLTQTFFAAGIKHLAVQRKPETRLWAVLEDGGLVCILYEPVQEVVAFVPFETDGDYNSVAVLPDVEQDRVYLAIHRIIQGSGRYFIEKMALDGEAVPSTLAKVMDAFIVKTGSASATVSGLDHLVGESVVAWGDGQPFPGPFTVSESGTITLPSAASSVVVGLPYTGRYKSARLAYGAGGGTAMLQKKIVGPIGLVLTDFARAGVRYGPDFEHLDPLPEMRDGVTAPAIVLGDIAEEENVTFGGTWSTDSRVCLQVSSPYPAHFLGLVMGVTTSG